MHEFSLASAILDLVAARVPPGCVLRRVHLAAGPLRGVDEHAMTLAWAGVTQGTRLAGSALDVEQLPWQLRCTACGRDIESHDAETTCPGCGRRPRVVGGDALRITSLTVDDIDDRSTL